MKKLLVLLFLFAASMAEGQTVPPTVNSEIHKENIIEDPEQQAEFPGGSSALLQYVTANTIYPQDALENKLEGNVYLRCIIDEKGILTDAKVAKGLSPSLDAEAIRIILNMPAWIPAQEDGQKVSSIVLLPIFFRIK